MKAPRPHHTAWQQLARGACVGLLLWAGLVGAADACRMSPLGKPNVVDGSVVTDGTFTTWYTHLTDRYRHGVLGDALEPTTLNLLSDATSASCGLSIVMERPYVFEDLAPRLFDLTGDGIPELVTIRSHERLGAQIAVFGQSPDGAALELVAETPHIGTANRWLAPAGIGDLDGAGAFEIAFVDRPHLVKTLRVWRYEEGALREVATLAGVTNHRIGEDFITGGLRNCGNGPEMVLVEANWSNIVAVQFTGGELMAERVGQFDGPGSVARAMDCR